MIIIPLCCVTHKIMGSLLSVVPPKVSRDPNPHTVYFELSTVNINETCLFPGNANPPPNITSWFQSKGHGKTRDDTASQIPHDIYVIGTQEDAMGEKDWIDIVRGTLRDVTNISFKQVQYSYDI